MPPLPFHVLSGSIIHELLSSCSILLQDCSLYQREIMVIIVNQDRALSKRLERQKRGSYTAHFNGPNLRFAARLVLFFGQLIGILPLEALQKSSRRRWNPCAIFSIIIMCLLSADAAVTIGTLIYNFYFQVPEYSSSPNVWIFYTSGAFAYIYFYVYGKELDCLFKLIQERHISFAAPDRRLAREINILAGITFLSAILENVLSHLTLFPVLDTQLSMDDKPNIGPLHIYYIRSHKLLAKTVPYDAIFTVYLFICDKLSLYSRNFLVLIIVIFARTLSFQFQGLYQGAKDALCRLDSRFSTDTSLWKILAKDHMVLYELFLQVEGFLSPIIFVVYGVNVYCVCTELYAVLVPTDFVTTTDQVHSLWALIHVSATIYVMTVYGAEMSYWAREVGELYRKCPEASYTVEVQRAERFWAGRWIGFSGAGCFVISKPLYLHIIGVIFTFEIILLQNRSFANYPGSGRRFMI